MTTHSFFCTYCNRPRSYKSSSTTGYGVNNDNEKICFRCCSIVDRDDMIETGKQTLYLSYEDHCLFRPAIRDYFNGKVGNWPGTLEFKAQCRRTPNGHNWGLTRYDVWFNGPDGHVWHGVQYGDNTQLVHCRRTKETY
jgi:hypothetical protein